MRPALFFALLILPFASHGQLTFEEVTTPDDFSIRILRKSPAGEYFMQLACDYESIYKSSNGQDWTQYTITGQYGLYVEDIQFFSDGTPVIHADGEDDYIWRNGSWQTLDPGTGWDNTNISFIRRDTLFIFNNTRLAYSTDLGLSYKVIGTYTGNIETEYTNLWVFDHHFALYSGVNDTTLSIFNRQGLRVANFPIVRKYPEDLFFNDCNELLIIDNKHFSLFREEGLQLVTGAASEILPDTFSTTLLQAHQGNFYVQDGDKIYSTPCGVFDWQLHFQDDLLDSVNRFWLTDDGNVLLFNYYGNEFYDQSGFTTDRTLYSPSIKFPCLSKTNESEHQRQVTRTANGIFAKLVNETNWIEYPNLDDSPGLAYSPDGDLYVSRWNDILLSKDNGATYSVIQLPFVYPYSTYTLFVVDRNLLFLHRAYYTNYVSYYSTNNGQDWKAVSLPMVTSPPNVKLVGNQIQITYTGNQDYVMRIHLGTGELTSHPIGYNTSGSAVTNDGTVYFRASPNGFQVNLYRYRFGEVSENLGSFTGLPNKLLASGNTVYAMGDTNYYSINEAVFTEHSYTGLPSDPFPVFTISENDHLYVVYGQNRIFRSKEVLSFERNMSGSIYRNTKEDCITDTLDPKMGSWVVKVQNDNFLRSTVTSHEGDFKTDLPVGEYKVSVKPINSYWEVCDSTFQVVVDLAADAISPDFLAIPLQHCAKLDLDFSTALLRRCFPNTYYITVRNTGPEPSIGTTVRFKLDPFFEFISSSMLYTQINSQVFEFDLGMLAVNETITFQVTVRVSCNAELGMEHCAEGSVFDNLLCDQERTTYIECQQNVGSYDPNDKRVFNEAGHETSQVDKGEYIYYNIRFQNTGTDTAFTVRIEDTLSTLLDYNTMEMISASHPYTYLLTDGPLLNVIFENIQLPDSNVNEPASHGYVKFRIKPMSGFDYGTSIPNTADIYFDFNDPVLTNSVTTVILPTVKTIESEKLIAFDVYPNPVNSTLHLSMSDVDRARIDEIEIVDPQGHVVLSKRLFDVIDVSALSPGIYVILLKENGVAIGVRKFLKL